MVPMDLPEISLTMITNFVQNKGFRGGSTRLKAYRSDLVWSDTCPATNTLPLLSPTPNSTDTSISTRASQALSTVSPKEMTHCKGPNGTCCIQIEFQYLHPLGRSSQVSLPTPSEQFILSLQYLFHEDIRSSILSNHPNADLIEYSVTVSNDVSIWKSPENTNGEATQVEIPVWFSICGNPILVHEIIKTVIDQLGNSESSLRNGVLSSKLKVNSYIIKEVSKADKTNIVGRNTLLSASSSSHIRSAQVHGFDENAGEIHDYHESRFADARYMSTIFIVIGALLTGGYFFYTIRHAIRSFRYR
jgi:hypothetical protein